MTPGSFDPTTCRAIVGDERARALEARARADADSADLGEPGAAYRPPAAGEGTYWDQVRSESEIRTYTGTPSTRALSAAAERRIPSTRAARMAETNCEHGPGRAALQLAGLSAGGCAGGAVDVVELVDFVGGVPGLGGCHGMALPIAAEARTMARRVASAR